MLFFGLVYLNLFWYIRGSFSGNVFLGLGYVVLWGIEFCVKRVGRFGEYMGFGRKIELIW